MAAAPMNLPAGTTQADIIPGLATGNPNSALTNPLPGSAGYGKPALPNQIIPDAGVYGQESAGALEAYNTAVTNALAQRNGLYHQMGLLNDGSVDPNNPYGQYQQMLNSEAAQLSADEQNAAGRNLGHGGLANQQVSTDRNSQAAQNFAFQQQAGTNEANYQSALASALSSKNSAVAQAYQDAINTALQNMIMNMESGNYTAGGDNSNNNSSSNNNSKTPTHQDTTDALSRYLANNAPPKMRTKSGRNPTAT